jgi:phosphatidylglycerol---prolipoprotein diacylglyceryl transferase
MYPTLYHAFLDLFGIDLIGLKFFNSFGFFVALAFLAAHFDLGSELRRKTANGLLQPTQRTITVGEAPRILDLVMQALVGFILGWKGVYIILNMTEVTADPPAFLLSAKGNIIGGILVGAFFSYMLWREKKKEQLPKPEQRITSLTPLQHAGNITLTAALWGFIGAKLFHWLENPRDFVNLFSGAGAKDIVTGLTMYGGLILAGFMVMRYFRQNGLAFWPSVDAAAPSVLMAYGIGRIGCQVSGDGDWGIANPAPAPSWIPNWLWSYDYPNNVNGVEGFSQKGGYVAERMTEGTIFPGYGTHLVPGVFPTPLYEAIACLLLFGVLCWLRKRIQTPGVIFSLFLIFDGVERFLIEKIRVNDAWLGTWTQAEVISSILVLSGLFGLWWFNRKASSGSADDATLRAT